MTRSITEIVRIKQDEGGVGLVQDKYTSLEKFDALKERFEKFVNQAEHFEGELSSLIERFEKFINQPAIKEAVENHKSNWVANSKGGEPNHKR
jgi:hypothetical protein